jgi:hypothetical protein
LNLKIKPVVTKIQLTKKKFVRVLLKIILVIPSLFLMIIAIFLVMMIMEKELVAPATSEVVSEAAIVFAVIVLSVETVEIAEVVSAEEVNVEVKSVVSADPKVKVLKVKSTVVEIVPGWHDLPDKKVVIFLDKMTMEKEEVPPPATEVELSVMVSLEAEVASEEILEEAAVALEVREEKVDSTDLKVKINKEKLLMMINKSLKNRKRKSKKLKNKNNHSQKMKKIILLRATI